MITKGVGGNAYEFAVCMCLPRTYCQLSVSQSARIRIDSPLTSTHDPFAIFTRSYARARFLELEILQQFYSVCVFGILLQTALPSSCQPFWKRSRGGSSSDGVHRDRAPICQLHAASICSEELLNDSTFKSLKLRTGIFEVVGVNGRSSKGRPAAFTSPPRSSQSLASGTCMAMQRQRHVSDALHEDLYTTRSN